MSNESIDENSKKKILLVDDELDNSWIFKIALEDNGFHVDTYNDPELALSALESKLLSLAPVRY